MMKTTVAALVVASVALAAPANAEPGYSLDDPTTDVCTGYHLGMTPSQIAEGLHRNDARINTWQSWNDTAWPIIDGECG